MSDVLVVAEHRDGVLRDVSFELLAAGRELADATGGDFHVSAIGGDVDGFATDLDREGVDVIHTVAGDAEFNHDVYRQVVAQLVDEVDPSAVLVPHSVDGMDYAPAVATSLSLPLVSDAVDLAFDETLVVTREEYGGKVETTLAVDAPSTVVTVRPGTWPAVEGDGDAEVRAFDATVDESAITSTVVGFEEGETGDVDISDAEFLVSIGRGIEEEDNLPLIEALVEVTGATLSASRPIVDNGWLPKDRQVGQSGKVVTPDVYLAIGISGAVQHVAGMKGSDTIVAVNTDPNAPIFDIADYGIVGDLFDVVPALIEAFGGESPRV